MKILKTAPGLDPHNYLAELSAPEHQVEEADFSLPLADQVADVHVFLTRDMPISADVIDAAPRLKLVQRYGHHVVNVDMAHARAKGVPVANIPSSVSGSNVVVAEHAFLLIMLLAKRFRESQRVLHANALGRPETTNLAGKTLGMVGLGGTGAELARLAKGFGMTVLSAKRNTKDLNGAEDHLDKVFALGDLGAMLACSDFVSIHLPLSPETVGICDAGFFAAMRPEAYLVNVARGEIVAKPALLQALADGTIAGAGIDVFWSEDAFDYGEFADIENLVATPHIAGASIDCLWALARAADANIKLVAAGEPPLNRLA